MAFEPNPSSLQSRALTYDAGLRSYFQRIYNVMTFGLVVTGLVAFTVAHSPALLGLFFGNIVMRFVVILSPFAVLFFGLSGRRVQTMSVQGLTMMFVLLSALLGLSLSTLFFAYSGQSMARAFFITAGMFAGTSLFGYTSKKDLSGMGSFMMMGLIGVILAGIVNMFLHSAPFQLAISVICVFVFTGLTAWQTQNLKQVYSYSGGTEANNKMAVMGAVMLYMNFINLFTTILQLTGGNRR